MQVISSILKTVLKVIGGTWFALFALLAILALIEGYFSNIIFSIILASIGLLPFHLFRKKKTVESNIDTIQETSNIKETVPSPMRQAVSMPINQYTETNINRTDSSITKFGSLETNLQSVPHEILELLWFKNGPHENYTHKPQQSYTVDLGYTQLTFSLSYTEEPSLIDISLPIDIKAIDCSSIGYYPSYYKLTSSQRYTYLNWLKDVTAPIDIGYVFVFYYGLERHLLFGKFEKAFEMVLKLKKYHSNGSFAQYSDDALLLSIMIHKRLEYLGRLNLNNLSTNVRFLVLATTVKAFSVEDIIIGHKKFSFDNARYIKSNYDLFKLTLEENLTSKYNNKEFQITFEDWKSVQNDFHMVISNYSLLPEQRVFKMPDITTAPRIQTELNKLLSDTHEQVKAKLRELRKKTPSNSQIKDQ